MSGVKVEGLRESLKGFKAAGVEAQDLKEAFTRIGAHVATQAQEQAPKDTGRLARGIKTARRQNMSIITSGGTSYHKYVHYGTKYMKANPYLYEAVDRETEWIERQVLIEMQQLIERVF